MVELNKAIEDGDTVLILTDLLWHNLNTGFYYTAHINGWGHVHLFFGLCDTGSIFLKSTFHHHIETKDIVIVELSEEEKVILTLSGKLHCESR